MVCAVAICWVQDFDFSTTPRRVPLGTSAATTTEAPSGTSRVAGRRGQAVIGRSVVTVEVSSSPTGADGDGRGRVARGGRRDGRLLTNMGVSRGGRAEAPSSSPSSDSTPGELSSPSASVASVERCVHTTSVLASTSPSAAETRTSGATSSWRDHELSTPFSIFVQYLVSGAADAEFFAEIEEERDEYFLSAVQCVLRAIERRRMLIDSEDWRYSFRSALASRPDMKLFKRAQSANARCQVRERRARASRRQSAACWS